MCLPVNYIINHEEVGNKLFQAGTRRTSTKHLTSEELENFLSTGTYQVAVLAYMNDKTIQIKDLSIDHKNDYYELCWTTQVKDIHANVEILQMEASAQLDTNGLVTYLNINDMFELQKILENQSP